MKQTCFECFNLKIVGEKGQVVGVKCVKEMFKGIQPYKTKNKGSGWAKRAETCVYYDDVEFYK